MAKFVGICVVLFVLAVGLVVVNQPQDMAALFGAFRSESLAQKLAWFLVVLIPLLLIPSALWLVDALLRQQRANAALELRLGGVREGVRELTKLQIDADAATHHLARTDPEAALGAVTQRLADAEGTAQVQESRNEIGDLQSQVDELRGRQQVLRERLVPVLEKRRSIERLFADLESRENDIERSLAEIASGDDATAIEMRLNNMMEFVRRSHERCDELDHAGKTIGSLKDDFIALRTRLEPHAAEQDGIKRRVRELGEAQEKLAANIEALQQTPQGSLAARVQAFADDKKQLEDGVADLEMQLTRLTTLRKDVEGVSVNFDRALELVSASGAGNADGRLAELSQFVKATQTRLDEIERNMATVGQLQGRLTELQSRLVPLESSDGGVADLIARVAEVRDRLAAKIERIEADENGDLATRVNAFLETKQELEKRVSTVNEHFSQLASIRNDIAGLFDKLSSAADAN
jgi:predicted  nucleic acid-binding Zn-ribbon protein